MPLPQQGFCTVPMVVHTVLQGFRRFLQGAVRGLSGSFQDLVRVTPSFIARGSSSYYNGASLTFATIAPYSLKPSSLNLKR